MSPYSIITLPPVKKCSGVNQERNLHQIKQRLQDKTDLNKYVRDNSRCTFSLEEELLWIMDVKNVLMLDLFQLKMLTDGLEWCGLLWCFYQTLILTAPIHCRACDAMLHFSKSDEETNSSTSSHDPRMSTFSANVHFWVNSDPNNNLVLWWWVLQKHRSDFLVKCKSSCHQYHFSHVFLNSLWVCCGSENRLTVNHRILLVE